LQPAHYSIAWAAPGSSLMVAMSRSGVSHGRYLSVLGVLFLVVWGILAVSPKYRHDWMLENGLALLFVIFLAISYKAFPLSRISYTLIFLFMCLHEVGAHYTYAEVPYDDWFQGLFGTTLNELLGWERNHYDRAIHFSYGLLLAYPIREVFLRVASVRGFWGYFLPLDLTMSTSMIFELIEWAAAESFGAELGQAYLGTQGDIWDAHKDMALASIGAMIAMTITAGLNIYLMRDFASEWVESLKVKGRSPLGEDEINRLLMKKKERGAP
jgi:putative membrane protein